MILCYCIWLFHILYQGLVIMNGVQPRLTAMPNSPFEHLSWHRSWWSWFNHTFFSQHSICAILSWQVIKLPMCYAKKSCPKHTVFWLNWHHCKVTLSRLAREVLIVGKGCLTCALHSGQKTVDMEQMLEKLVCTCKMFHALWMRLDDLIQKDHGPVYIYIYQGISTKPASEFSLWA